MDVESKEIGFFPQEAGGFKYIGPFERAGWFYVVARNGLWRTENLRALGRNMVESDWECCVEFKENWPVLYATMGLVMPEVGEPDRSQPPSTVEIVFSIPIPESEQ